jgi:hypothetical protein
VKGLCEYISEHLSGWHVFNVNLFHEKSSLEVQSWYLTLICLDLWDLAFVDLIKLMVLMLSCINKHLLRRTPKSVSRSRIGNWTESNARTNSASAKDFVTNFCFDDLHMIDESNANDCSSLASSILRWSIATVGSQRFFRAPQRSFVSSTPDHFLTLFVLATSPGSVCFSLNHFCTSTRRVE